MLFTEVRLSDQADAAQFSSEVKELLVQILPMLAGQRVSVGLDALLSAYITTASHNSVADTNKQCAACLRKAADMLEMGAFDQSSAAAGNAVH